MVDLHDIAYHRNTLDPAERGSRCICGPCRSGSDCTERPV